MGAEIRYFAILVILMFFAGFILSSGLNPHKQTHSKVSIATQAPSLSVVRAM